MESKRLGSYLPCPTARPTDASGSPSAKDRLLPPRYPCSVVSCSFASPFSVRTSSGLKWPTTARFPIRAFSRVLVAGLGVCRLP